MVNKSTLKLVKNYLNLISKEGLNIKRAFIFGSAINNKTNKDSDIDVLLVSEGNKKISDVQIGKVWDETKISDYKIEPIIINEKKFNENDTPLISLVKSEGYEVSWQQ